MCIRDSHKPECHAEKLVHCVQCRGHNEGLYNQNMSISVVSSKLLVDLQPNLVWLIKSRLICYLQGQGHWQSSCNQNMTISIVSFELLILLLPNLVLQYIIISQGVYGEIGLLCSRSRSQQNFKMSMNVCPDDIFWIAEPFTAKLGMVMHHYEPDCLPKRLVCYLQGQGHSEGSYNQNMTF